MSAADWRATDDGLYVVDFPPLLRLEVYAGLSGAGGPGDWRARLTWLADDGRVHPVLAPRSSDPMKAEHDVERAKRKALRWASDVLGALASDVGIAAMPRDGGP